jgi:hypothetical protein
MGFVLNIGWDLIDRRSGIMNKIRVREEAAGSSGTCGDFFAIA